MASKEASRGRDTHRIAPPASPRHIAKGNFWDSLDGNKHKNEMQHNSTTCQGYTAMPEPSGSGPGGGGASLPWRKIHSRSPRVRHGTTPALRKMAPNTDVDTRMSNVWSRVWLLAPRSELHVRNALLPGWRADRGLRALGEVGALQGAPRGGAPERIVAHLGYIWGGGQPNGGPQEGAPQMRAPKSEGLVAPMLVGSGLTRTPGLPAFSQGPGLPRRDFSRRATTTRQMFAQLRTKTSDK